MVDTLKTFDFAVWTEAVLGQVQQAQEQGYQLIMGLLTGSRLYDPNMKDLPTDNVYQVVALVKTPELWDPHQADSHLLDCGACPLYYYFDQELTEHNRNGELVYSLPIIDELGHSQFLNTDKYQEYSLDLLRSTLEKRGKTLLTVHGILYRLLTNQGVSWEATPEIEFKV